MTVVLSNVKILRLEFYLPKANMAPRPDKTVATLMWTQTAFDQRLGGWECRTVTELPTEKESPLSGFLQRMIDERE